VRQQGLDQRGLAGAVGAANGDAHPAIYNGGLTVSA
jgi:hypothetical protein